MNVLGMSVAVGKRRRKRRWRVNRVRIAVVRTVVARRVLGWVRAVVKLDLEEVRSVKVSLVSTSLRSLDAVCCTLELTLFACSARLVVSVDEDDQKLNHGMLVRGRPERWLRLVTAQAG